MAVIPEEPRVRPLGPARGASRDREPTAVDGALAVLAVAAALVRYAAEVAERRRRALFPRLPAVRPPGRGPLGRVLAHPASAAVRALSAVADVAVPEVTRAVLSRLDLTSLVREFVDLDRLAAALDVGAVVDRVDLDAVVARVDIDRVAARLDLDAVIARLDLDALVDKVDVSRVVDRVDLDAVVARVDLDRAVERVDLDRAVERVDLDAVVGRVDVDAVVDRVDVDRVLERTDLAGVARYVVQEIDLPGLLRASTGSVTAEMVRGVRDQGADADRAVERVVDRLLHRSGRRTATAGPEADGDRR
ncbi:hypothetical protein ACI797_15950 [Geodermatophilus sp. SYSU D00691]